MRRVDSRMKQCSPQNRLYGLRRAAPFGFQRETVLLVKSPLRGCTSPTSTKNDARLKIFTLGAATLRPQYGIQSMLIEICLSASLAEQSPTHKIRNSAKAITYQICSEDRDQTKGHCLSELIGWPRMPTKPQL